ncbi:hypothetical protein [Pedobacter agri]|uniref:phosphoribosyltransferase n=1 Tax=Pedobacter agri TaxID=454586 RepID=UPI0029304D40|nr:hypothetical protein [Pedobacter agri]
MIDLSKQWQYEKLDFKGCWHLAYYIPNKRGNGTLAGKMIDFKDGDLKSINSWSQWAGDELSKLGIEFHYIIRALGSNELEPLKGKPCAIMGANLGKRLGAKYAPWLINKKRATKSLHTLKTYQERFDELHEVYIANDKGGEDLNNKNVLIIDDITTTNCTIAEMKRAIFEKWPEANLHLFCLGKTEYDQASNDTISLKYF